MSGAEFLLWVRGPGLQIATVIFVFGIVLRLVETLMLGRKKNLAELRANGVPAGLRTVFSRTLPADANTFKRSMFTIVAGYVFHLGLFAAIFLLTPHIQLFRSLTGVSWPGLPTPIVDFLTVLAMIALIAILWRRLTHPLLRFLSRGSDYLAWLLTFLPLLTGYMAYHHLLVPYTWMLGLHILSVEILMVLFPFTKLMHTFTLFVARYYNGSMAGEKGVQQ